MKILFFSMKFSIVFDVKHQENSFFYCSASEALTVHVLQPFRILSLTVSCLCMISSWGTNPTNFWNERIESSDPHILIDPFVLSSFPERTDNSDVFPDPLAPMIAASLPAVNFPETLSRIVLFPFFRQRSWNSMSKANGVPNTSGSTSTMSKKWTGWNWKRGFWNACEKWNQIALQFDFIFHKHFKNRAS